MTTVFRPRTMLATLVVAVCLAAPALASITFSDGTFDLANYGPLLTYVTDPGMTSAVQQITSGGNPGDAVQFTLTFPGTGTFEGYQGLISNSWFYDPGTQGALASITFSEDKFIHQDGTITLTGSNVRLLLLQGGNYYIGAVPVNPVFDTWAGGSGVLTAADFAYFDFVSGTFDATVHPDFSSGVLQFGLANYYGLVLNGGLTLTTNFDNYSATLNPVPEPSSLLLLGSGIVGLSGLARRKM